MPTNNANKNIKNIAIAGALVTIILAAAGYFAWNKYVHESTKIDSSLQDIYQYKESLPPKGTISPAPEPPMTEPLRTPTADPFKEAATPNDIPSSSASAPETPLATTPSPSVVMKKPVTQTPVDPCAIATNKLDTFFSYLDEQEYVADYGLNEKSKDHLIKLAEKLYAHPPVVTRETDNLFTILTNSAHFYRVLGKTDVLLLKDILTNEADQLETIMADFYNWSKTEPSCGNHPYPLPLPLKSLYEYAGFFLNTLGGQSYLFRRESITRMLVKFYSVLIIDQANEKGLNRHGIDIRAHLRSTIEEMEVSQGIENRDDYVSKLLYLQDKYLRKYGNK